MKMIFTGNSHCGIVEFYEGVARQLGFTVSEEYENLEYDCTKIDVAVNIQKDIFDYYEERGHKPQTSAMWWCCYGPKAYEEYAENEIHIEEGFIREVEK